MAQHVEEHLPLYANGSLDDEGRRVVEGHLQMCAACTASLAAWSNVADAVRATSGSAPGYTLLDRVFAEVDGPGAPAPAPVVVPITGRRGAPRSLAVLGVAAVVLVVLGFASSLTGDQDEPDEREILFAAAESAREAGTARLVYEGSLELQLDPEVAGVPAGAGPVVAELRGDGEVVLPDRSRTRVGFEIVEWPVVGEERPEGSVTETVRIGDTVYERDDAARFSVRDDEPQGFVSSALFATDIAALLEAATGEISEVDAGGNDRRYRFPVGDDALSGEVDVGYDDVETTVEVLVDGDDERVLELRIELEGQLVDPVVPGRVRVDVTIEVTDLGAPLTVEAPPASQVEED